MTDTQHRNHSRSSGLIKSLVLTFALVSLAGCNTSNLINAPRENQDAPTKREIIPMESIPFHMEYLENLWTTSDHDDWDVLTVTVDPTRNQQFVGVPDSWPSEYEFKAFFPRGCINSTEPFTFSISIPHYDIRNPHPAVYLLEPHGMEFELPIEMEFCYPPWLEAKEAYGKFHFWREEVPPPSHPDKIGEPGGVDPEIIYRMSDYERVNPNPDNWRLGLRFETYHFSRWAVSNGSGGDDYLIYDDGLGDPFMTE